MSRRLSAASMREDERRYGLFLMAENAIARSMIEAALEAGLQSSDAVRLGIGVYKELDVLARDADLNMLDAPALEDIRLYCRAILRSGATFSAFEIATRAIRCWRETVEELELLRAEWDRELVTSRLKLQRIRQAAAAKVAHNRE